MKWPPHNKSISADGLRPPLDSDLTRANDFVVIHDPQPLAIRDYVTVSQDRSTWWIWRCHIDTSTPDQGLYDYLLPSINHYDAAVYTLRDYVPQGRPCGAAQRGQKGRLERQRPRNGAAILTGSLEVLGADDGSRTRDLQLGKLTCCQLHYIRPQQ